MGGALAQARPPLSPPKMGPLGVAEFTLGLGTCWWHSGPRSSEDGPGDPPSSDMTGKALAS